jgi:hypothetical protein
VTDLDPVFTAMAGAAAALIGLLFVAVSVSPERVTGSRAPQRQQIRASMALTSLVSPLLLSLIALLPDTGVGWPACVIGASGIVFVASTTVRIVREEGPGPSRRRFLFSLAGFLAATSVMASTGVRLIVHSHDTGVASGAAAAAIALLAIGIERSWELVGGHSTGLTDMIADLVIGPSDIDPIDAPVTPTPQPPATDA